MSLSHLSTVYFNTVLNICVLIKKQYELDISEFCFAAVMCFGDMSLIFQNFFLLLKCALVIILHVTSKNDQNTDNFISLKRIIMYRTTIMWFFFNLSHTNIITKAQQKINFSKETIKTSITKFTAFIALTFLPIQSKICS